MKKNIKQGNIKHLTFPKDTLEKYSTSHGYFYRNTGYVWGEQNKPKKEPLLARIKRWFIKF